MLKVCPVCGVSYSDATIFCPADGSTLRAAEADGDLIGSVLADRYLVTDLLGEGGMGKVYLARHVRLPQQAAIKVLRPEMLRDPAAVARFNREAANASRIEHERIARVFDFGESADGTFYLAMEFVPGRTLKQIVTTDGAQTPERTATITRQVGEALDAAHRLGIVHRDLKPDNVMVIEDAEVGDRCKVVDFGIAKAVGGSADEAGLTKTGFIVGTPDFMSPEQLLGENVDHRSDVYALALLSFQCLTGTLPFDSTTPERAMTARLVEQPRSLATVSPDTSWPAAVQTVFDRGLAKSADDRYASAGAFARDLASAIASWNSPPVEQQTAPAAISHLNQAPRDISGQDSIPQKASENHTTKKSSKQHFSIIGGISVALLGAAALIFVLTRETPPSNGSRATDSLPVSAAESVAAAPPALSQDNTNTEQSNESRATQETLQSQQDASVIIPPPIATVAPNRVAGAPVVDQRSPITTALQPAPTSNATAMSSAAQARLTLDSLRSAIDPLTATPAQAREGVAALRVLMPRLGSAEDSAWALLRQAEAHFIMNDARSACVALKAAQPLVRTSGQRDIMTLMSGSISNDC